MVCKELDDHQFGALRGRSTTLALVDALHHWHEAFGEGQSVRILFVDYAKAFDHVDHSTVIQKLKSLGVPDFIVRTERVQHHKNIRKLYHQQTQYCFLSIWQYRLAIGIMFSLRSSVRLFVTNFWTLYFEDEWTDFNADWHKSYPGARAWAVDLSHQEIKGKGAQEAWWRHHVRYLESSR